MVRPVTGGSAIALLFCVLKITITNQPKAIALKLEGAIAGNWVPELARSWQALRASLDHKEVSIDLREVTHVDSEGKNLLAEIYGETGASFLADRPLTQYFAEEAVRRRLRRSHP